MPVAAAIISVSNKENLYSCWEKLVKGKVYSVPVYDGDSKKYLGLPSLTAVIGRLLELFGSKCGSLFTSFMANSAPGKMSAP